MKITINIPQFIGSIIGLYITYSIISGKAQSVIGFEDPINEIATATISFIIGFGLLLFSFEKVNK